MGSLQLINRSDTVRVDNNISIILNFYGVKNKMTKIKRKEKKNEKNYIRSTNVNWNWTRKGKARKEQTAD